MDEQQQQQLGRDAIYRCEVSHHNKEEADDIYECARKVG